MMILATPSHFGAHLIQVRIILWPVSAVTRMINSILVVEYNLILIILISAKKVEKGCDELKDIQEGAGIYGFDKDKIKQGSCFTASTLEAEMNDKMKEAFKGCGNLTAMACICNTDDCNNITINDRVPEIISSDQKFFTLKARVIDEATENSAHRWFDHVEALKLFVILHLIEIFSSL